MSEETERTQPIKTTQPVKAHKPSTPPPDHQAETEIEQTQASQPSPSPKKKARFGGFSFARKSPPAPEREPEPGQNQAETTEPGAKKKWNLKALFPARTPLASPAAGEQGADVAPPESPAASPRKKFSPGRFFISLLVFLAIIGLGVFGGYQSGINVRKRAETSLISQQLTDQYSRALVDMQFGKYNTARQRLEYIISINPSFPGAIEKLTEVMVMTNIPTPTPVFTLTPELIVDTTNYEALFAQAQQLTAAGQWQNALTVLDTLRQKNPTFNTVQVDGMYYFSLRNLGVDMIKSGNLEGGIYQLTLAERFAPLDNTAHILRDNARFYITAASFWELNWQLSAEYFSQLNGSGIWDGTMTATERYHIAAMRYGDELVQQEMYCEAYDQYMAAQAIGELDAAAAKGANQAYQACYPPTEIPIIETPTEDTNSGGDATP